MHHPAFARRFGATALLAFALAPAHAATGAPAPAIPQAPSFPVVASSLTLPFTLEGGGDIELAVLTGDQTPAQAQWKAASTLPLAPYAGQDIRVLARATGESNQANWFDSSYKVRSSFSPAVGVASITPDNPVVAIPGNSELLRGFASGWTEFAPGPNVDASWKTPQNAVGPVGGTGYEGNTNVVVLGDRGAITMTFPSAIYDGPGDDLAVFENGFRVNGTTEADFVELGRLQVSSNGTDFVEFDSATTHTATVSGYAGAPARAYGGLAGRELNGYGTPFDLTSLRNKQAVREGKVDLQRITHVRIVDIVGDGNDRDSFGRSIFDAFPTYGSGGFDLRGIGATHLRGAGIPRPSVLWTGPSSMRVQASASPGLGGDQTVRLELARGTDIADPTIVETAELPGDVASKDLVFDVNGLFSGQEYSWRLVAENGAGEQTPTKWTTFTKSPAVLGTPSAPAASQMVRSDAGIDVSATLGVTPNTDGVLHLKVEYGTTDESGDPVESTKKTVDAGVAGPASAQTIKAAKLLGLPAHTKHWLRWVATRSNGTKLTSATATFTTSVPGTTATPTAGRIVTASYIKFPVTVKPNTAGDQAVVLAYSTTSGFTAPTTQRTAPVIVAGDKVEQALVLKAENLTALTRYYVRAEVTDGAGTRNSSSANFLLPGSLPLTPDPLISAVNGPNAKFTSSVNLGTYGPLRTRFELSKYADGSYAITLGEEVRTAGGTHTATATDLTPGQDYWVRTVGTPSEETGPSVASNWVKFTSASLTNALGVVTPTTIGRRTAAISTTVMPGDFDRSVALEWTADPAKTTATLTAPVTVAAGAGETTLPVTLDGLTPATQYWFRAVSTVAGSSETTDWATFTTEARDVIAAELSASRSELLLGEPVTLTWSTSKATEVTAAGSWSGPLDASGRREVTPAAVGEHRFELTATGDGEPQTVAIVVNVKAKAVIGDDVGQPKGEQSTPQQQPGPRSPLTDPKTPNVAPVAKLGSKQVKAGGRQRVTITGLTPGGRVTVTYRGRRVSASGAKAFRSGRLVVGFPVGKKRGKATLIAKDRTTGRTITVTFKVR